MSSSETMMAWLTSFSLCSFILFKILLAAFLRACALDLLATVNG